ncbi:MAG: hypothetical protein HW403_1148 [Dehalococcoidia bacterium]|nr:hypothetical protein [Dehalococcoidia bacterium]
MTYKDKSTNWDLLVEYAGQWIAVLNNEVVASAPALKQVIDALEERGLSGARPRVFMVPREDERLIVL